MSSDIKVTNSGAFEWDDRKANAAISLARGRTFEESAKAAGVTRKTVHEWNTHVEFMDEVDRLTLLVGYAQKVERLRLANRIINGLAEKIKPTNRDLLEWLKFAQSETDGTKLDLAAVFANLAGDASAADGDSAEAEDTALPTASS